MPPTNHPARTPTHPVPVTPSMTPPPPSPGCQTPKRPSPSPRPPIVNRPVLQQLSKGATWCMPPPRHQYFLTRADSSRQIIHGFGASCPFAKGRLGACRPQDTRQSAETMYYLSRAVSSRQKIHVLWGAYFLTLAPVAGLAPTNSSAKGRLGACIICRELSARDQKSMCCGGLIF